MTASDAIVAARAYLLKDVTHMRSDPRGCVCSASASIIVFANKKYKCDHIAHGLSGEGWKSVAIHGDKEQWERQKALERFSKNEVQIIVATDVAGRGLDIKGVSHVINYDFPDNGVEDWVHRVGRTGRAGAKGTAVTFFNASDDRKSAKELCKVLSDAKSDIPDWLVALGNVSIHDLPLCCMHG